MSTDYLMSVSVSGPGAGDFDFEALRDLDSRRGAVGTIGVRRYDSGGAHANIVTTVGYDGYVDGSHGTERALAERAQEIVLAKLPGARCIQVRVLRLEGSGRDDEWYNHGEFYPTEGATP